MSNGWNASGGGFVMMTSTAALRLIHNRPGPLCCENAGTGPLRPSSRAGRIKAILGKSRIEAEVAVRGLW